MPWSDYWRKIRRVRFKGEPFSWKFYEILLDKYDFRNKRVLEIGCGTGIDSIMMGLRGAKISFLDQSREALEIVKDNLERFSIDAELLNGDVFDYDFNGDFNLIHSNGTVEHFTGGKRQEIVDIHARAAKKGGKVVLIVPNNRCVPYRIGKIASEMTGNWIYGREIPYTKKELEFRMERAGLKVEKIAGGEFLFSFVWLFAPIFMGSVEGMRKGITFRERKKLVKLNYNNRFANRWGRVIGGVGVKV
jgi:2-polyprenyl-3-methyl-5-hydroxy-6-metoxy-1,4-benzoquinol methylase